jgi:hypothetical protein
MASTSPERIAWISEFVFVMKRNAIESSFAGFPYQPRRFFVSVTPEPRSKRVRRNGPSEMGALPFFGLQMQSFQTVIMSVPAKACCGRT